MGPTYRAGVLRSAAIDRMEEMEKKLGVESVAYEMLGPPRLTKLLFEGSMLKRMFGTYDAALELDPEETASRAQTLVETDDDLRQRIVSTGVPILVSDGGAVLRGRWSRCCPRRTVRWKTRWWTRVGWISGRRTGRSGRRRIRAVVRDRREEPGVEKGSRTDHDYGDAQETLRPGRLAAWVFRVEDEGDRIKW